MLHVLRLVINFRQSFLLAMERQAGNSVQTLFHQITFSKVGKKLSRACGMLNKTQHLCLGHPQSFIPALPHGAECPGTSCWLPAGDLSPSTSAFLLVALSPARQRLGAGRTGVVTAGNGAISPPVQACAQFVVPIN